MNSNLDSNFDMYSHVLEIKKKGLHDLCFSHFQLFHSFDKKMRLQDTIAVQELILIFFLVDLL